MKLLSIKKTNLLFSLGAICALIVSSCTKQSLEDPIVENGPVEEVLSAPFSFNWATSKTIDVRIVVDDLYEGKYFYKLELFDREPHAEGAVLLGAGLAKKGQDLTTKITIPTNLTQIFVQKTNPIGEVSYSIYDINSLNPSISSVSANTNRMSSINNTGLIRAAVNMANTTSAAILSTSSTLPSIPASAVQLVGDATVTAIPSSKAYIIKSGDWFSGNLPVLDQAGVEGVVVYVQGKWHHSRDINLGRSNKIIVLPGGELNVNGLLLNNGTASFENYGDVLLGSLKLGSDNSFSNIGTLRINGAVSMVGKAQFWNGQKDVKVKVGSLSMTDAGSVVTNDGEIEILNGTFNNGTLNANCYTTVGTMQSNNATVNIRSEAMLDVTNLTAVAGVYNLELKAVLDVTKVATFKSDNNKAVDINSYATDASNKSFVRIKYVRVFSKNNVHLNYRGNLIVVTDEHPLRSENNFTTSGNSAVEIIWDKYNHPPFVARTKCNNGGIGTAPTTPPASQALTSTDLGTYSYLFEDNWPKVGDFDMNDFVMDVDVVRYQNQDNKVVKVVLTNKVRALGATKRLAAAIQLDNVLANNIKSVSYSQPSLVGTTFPLTSIGIESDQTQAVVAIVDDAHAAFGLKKNEFVFTNNAGIQPVETTITIEFNTPLSSFTHADLNPFIVSVSEISKSSTVKGGFVRPEVHLVGRSASDKIDYDKITNGKGVKGQLSTTDPFKTFDNLPFAISAPISINYSIEGKKFTVFYPDFAAWVNSGGTTNTDWYTNYVSK